MMKSKTAAAAAAAAAALALCFGLSAPVFANDEHHPEKAGAAPAAVAPSAPKPVAKAVDPTTVKAMQQNASRMQSQLRKIAAARSGDEKKQLMAEHMRTLQDNMMMAKGMGMGAGMESCPMMEGASGGMGMTGGIPMQGGMGAQGAAKTPADASERMDSMEMLEKMKVGVQPDAMPGSPKQ